MEINSYPKATRVFFQTAKEWLEKADRQNVCDRTGAGYDSSRDQYVLQYLGSTARIDASSCSMEWDLPISSLFHITLLHYLMFADGSKPKGELATLYDLAPVGSTRVDHMMRANIPPLIEVFGNDIELFFECAEKLGGSKISDNTAEILILPHIPSQVTVWPKDDEFPADARILFDKTLRGQLCAEDIVYTADVVVQALVAMSGREYHFLSI